MRAVQGEWFDRGVVLPALTARDPRGVIAEIISALADERKLPDGPALIAAVQEREGDSPTALGHGAALPHVRTSSTREMLLVFGRSTEGFIWTPTAERVRLVFGAIVPPNAGAEYLALVRRLTLALRQPEWSEALDRAEDAAQLRRILAATPTPRAPR